MKKVYDHMVTMGSAALQQKMIEEKEWWNLDAMKMTSELNSKRNSWHGVLSMYSGSSAQERPEVMGTKRVGGLHNNGNTCYFNVPLQLLRDLPGFLAALQHDIPNFSPHGAAPLQQQAVLVLGSRTTAMNPKDLHTCLAEMLQARNAEILKVSDVSVHNEIFAMDREQHDASELVVRLLEILNDCLDAGRHAWMQACMAAAPPLMMQTLCWREPSLKRCIAIDAKRARGQPCTRHRCPSTLWSPSMLVLRPRMFSVHACSPSTLTRRIRLNTFDDVRIRFNSF